MYNFLKALFLLSISKNIISDLSKNMCSNCDTTQLLDDAKLIVNDIDLFLKNNDKKP